MGKFSILADKIGQSYSMGDIIFNQGDEGDAMYIIYEGEVEITREHGDKDTFLAQLGPGEIFGEMALVDAKQRSASAVATRDTKVIPLTAEFLKKNIRRDSTFIFQVIETLILRLDQTRTLLGQSAQEPDTSDEGEEIVANEVNVLSFLSMFRGFADADRYLEFDEGDNVFSEGDPGDLMFMILEGDIEICIGEGSSKKILAVMERGDFFGESALITDLPRSATATAVSQSILLPFVRKDLVEGLIADPDAALQFVQVLIIRLRNSLDAISN